MINRPLSDSYLYKTVALILSFSAWFKTKP
jgi:hypothetical protein